MAINIYQNGGCFMLWAKKSPKKVYEWKIINSKEEADELSDLYCNFHDGCLKEIWFSSGAHLKRNFTISAISNPIARFLIQRPWPNPRVIEIEFTEIVQINIKPEGDDVFIEILDTRLYFEDGIFFWSVQGYQINDEDKDKYTWIAAKKVRWRVVEELIGEETVYKNRID